MDRTGHTFLEEVQMWTLSQSISGKVHIHGPCVSPCLGTALTGAGLLFLIVQVHTLVTGMVYQRKVWLYHFLEIANHMPRQPVHLLCESV